MESWNYNMYGTLADNELHVVLIFGKTYRYLFIITVYNKLIECSRDHIF
jgi:hypothetical protein